MELAQRVARLEAIEAIRQLKARYAAVCDDGYKPAGIVPLFTEDAVWDATTGDFGRHEGREAICAFFAGVSGPISWAPHCKIAPAIEVADGLRTATGTWYIFSPSTINGEAMWVMGRYADRYRNDGGGWRLSEVVVDIEAVTPFDAGWVEQQFSGG